jgi:hypothetical protein
MKLNIVAGLATSAALMLGAGNASAVCGGDACLVDEFGTEITIYFDDANGDGWEVFNIGTFVGYLESPPGFSDDPMNPIVCPLSGEYVVIDDGIAVPDVRDIRAGLFSNCWCGEGGNPAKRAMALSYDKVADKVLVDDSLSSAHAFRCDGQIEVFDQFTIGTLPDMPTMSAFSFSSATSTPTSTPEFATSTPLF